MASISSSYELILKLLQVAEAQLEALGVKGLPNPIKRIDSATEQGSEGQATTTQTKPPLLGSPTRNQSTDSPKSPRKSSR